MGLTVYGLELSAPCRLVYMTCELVRKDYKKHLVNVLEGDQMKPWFLELNPQHTVPTVKDDSNDLVLSESKAIACYLANAYDDEGKLYPRDDLQVRAKIDQLLHFDSATLFKRLVNVTAKALKQTPPESDYEKLEEALAWANDFVKPTGYMAGTDHLTLADVALVASYSTAKTCGVADTSKYPELNAWFDRVTKQIPNYDDANGAGARAVGDFFSSSANARN